MNRNSKQQARGALAGVLIVGAHFADLIFLLLVSGGVCEVLWRAGYTPDWIGLGVLAAWLGGILAWLFFAPMAFLHLFADAAAFWRSLHPLNLGLATTGATMERVWFGVGFGAVTPALAGIAAAIAGWIAAPFFVRHPRAGLWIAFAICFGISAFSWRFPYLRIAVSAGGAGLLALWLRIYQISRQSENTPPTDAPTIKADAKTATAATA